MGSKIFYWEGRGKNKNKGKKIKISCKERHYLSNKASHIICGNRWNERLYCELCISWSITLLRISFGNKRHLLWLICFIKLRRRIKSSYQLRKSSKGSKIFLIFFYVIRVHSAS
jgi:hypothetical protein